LDFFSIGTNDLIAEMYDIQRDDVNANEYYKDVLPRIVYEIARVAQGAAAADKKVKVCGELASKRQFWIVRRILSEMGITFGLSMPANDIPYFNGVMEVLDDRAGPLMQRYEQVEEMVEKVIADEQPPALDGKYRQEFNDQLAELTGMVDHSLKKIVSATLGIDLPQSAEEGDQAMIADGSVNRRHGGVDFTRHRETVTRKQEEIPALTVSTGDGQSVTIGGEDFAGFTFEIIRMAPYDLGS
jgi:hypothetical protein